MKESFNSAFRVHFHFYYLFHFFSRGGKVLFFALALLAAGPAAVSAAGPEGCSEQGVPPATASAPTEGLKAYVDPETGELVSEPPPGETEAPESVSMVQAEPEYKVDALPDGTLVLDLGELPAEELHAEVVDGKAVLCHGPGPMSTEDTEK